MKNYVGIDLGTTNSVICSYDGNSVRLWKSPEQADVTPSAIFIDRRGNRYYGLKAYNQAAISPDSTAVLFKRFMGTGTPILLPAVNVTMTPEECSAEILKVLYGYLPEEVRQDGETATVITVPAAFNQVQKEATLRASKIAGIQRAALIQEPVAAVMSCMRIRKQDGIFMVYDLGGGTLDIAVAESIGGRVNLLTHGGIAMCGGRDFDRMIWSDITLPWLLENFNLPEDIQTNQDYKILERLATWAGERAKIELSAREEAAIALSESDIRLRDLNGNEIYLDVLLKREDFNRLMAEQVESTIDAAKETLIKGGLTVNDLERVVFVGGPTLYKPLRDRISQELGIPYHTDINPMTAVAEGASVFAESIDFSTEKHYRKPLSLGFEAEEIPVKFKYIARTSTNKAQFAVQAEGEFEGFTFQVSSADTGWTSGRVPLKNNALLELALSKEGDNTFFITAYNEVGHPVKLKECRIVIAKTAAMVGAIPASHSVGIEVLDRIGGTPRLSYLIREGDALPKKGTTLFKATQTVRAGAGNMYIRFRLWEGEIEEPVTDNRHIGELRITGSDFEIGVIMVGADIECTYEMLDSGNIVMNISIPSIGAVFDKNFYSFETAKQDFTAGLDRVLNEAEKLSKRLATISSRVDDQATEDIGKILDGVLALQDKEPDTETVQKAAEDIFEAKKLLARLKKEYKSAIRQLDMDWLTSIYYNRAQPYANPGESESLENFIKTVQRSIDQNSSTFESELSELNLRIAGILWRQDWFIIEMFKNYCETPYRFTDPVQFETLREEGKKYLKAGDIKNLDEVCSKLIAIKYEEDDYEEMYETVNIIKA